MDSLALLCNLHADGPATLSRLRREGCRSLADLERLGPESVAEMLQVPPAMARRLTKEARLLLDRVGEMPLDPEEAPDGLVVPFAPAAERTPSIPQEVARLSADLNHSAARELESETNQPTPRHESLPEGLPETQSSGGFRTHPGEQPAFQKPVSSLRQAPISGEPKQRLVPGQTLIGAVDGLDSIVAQALAGAGVTELADLVDVDPSLLARQTGIHFSGIRRMQFLARRALAEPELKPAYTPEPLPPRHREPAVEAPGQPEQAEVSASPAAASAPEFQGQSAGFELAEDLDHPIEAPVEETLLTPALPVSSGEDVQETAAAPAKFTYPDDATQEAQTEEESDVVTGQTLPDHPVAEFEPQSGGPMVQGVEPGAREVPIGRWLPKSQRPLAAELVADAPAEEIEAQESPEPVLVPPPPPRRFWEPKRFWEARKNRRERAAMKARTETENLPEEMQAPDVAEASTVQAIPSQKHQIEPSRVTETGGRSMRHGPVIPESQRPDLTPAQGTSVASRPAHVEVEPLEPANLGESQALAPARLGQNQSGALRWNFAEPVAKSDNSEAKKDSRAGFEYSEPPSQSTREDASGPFA